MTPTLCSFVEQYLARQSENSYCLAGLARVAVHYVGLQLGGEAADAGTSPPEGVGLDRIEVWLDDAERSASGGRYPASLWVSVYNARGQLSILRGDVEGPWIILLFPAVWTLQSLTRVVR